MPTTIRIVRPSSREAVDLLLPRIGQLRDLGLIVLHDDIAPDPSWAYTAGSIADRAAQLNRALCEPGVDVVVCARGGYGASDLLQHLDLTALQAASPRVVSGFSDVSAIHSALYSRLGWPGLHAPMPATVLWQTTEQADVIATVAAWRSLATSGAASGSVSVTRFSGPGRNIRGRLFGGCFSVLTNLIGTRYFPASLRGHIVFFEDTDEHPGRLVRALNQWLQSGALDGVEAVLVGHLRKLGEKIPDCAPFVIEEIARRLPCPVYHTAMIGHTSPNLPVGIGADCEISGSTFNWQLGIKSPALS